MPLSGISVNNPQEENPTSLQTPQLGGNPVSFGGNSIGGSGGAASATSTDPTAETSSFSTILFYGAIALVIIFILKKIGS